jgi:hypothetical protein
MLPLRRTPPIARGPSCCAFFEDLPDSLALRVLAHLSSTQAQLSGQRVCHRWRTLTRSLHARGELAARVIVTCSGDNTVAVIDPALPSGRSVVQRFTPLPPPRRRRAGGRLPKGHWRSCKGLYNWPTCMAFGPDPGSLYVSQYRVRGVLRFDTDSSGSTYRYSRTVVSSPHLTTPEGLVVNADGSMYVISVVNATVNYVSAAGKIIQTTRLDGHGFLCAWGMSRSSGSAGPVLCIAVHSSDGGEYTSPTPQDTGCVIHVELDTVSGRMGRVYKPVVAGCWVTSQPASVVVRQRLALGSAIANRPSNPCIFWPRPSESSGHPWVLMSSFLQCSEGNGQDDHGAMQPRGIVAFSPAPDGANDQHELVVAIARGLLERGCSPWGLCSGYGGRTLVVTSHTPSKANRADTDHTDHTHTHTIVGSGVPVRASGGSTEIGSGDERQQGQATGVILVWGDDDDVNAASVNGGRWREVACGLDAPNYVLMT